MILNIIYGFLYILTRTECINPDTIGENNLWKLSTYIDIWGVGWTWLQWEIYVQLHQYPFSIFADTNTVIHVQHHIFVVRLTVAMDGWVKPYIQLIRVWLKSNMLHTKAKKFLEVISCTWKYIEISDNNSLLTLIFWYKFRATSGPIIIRARFYEIIILDISCHNTNPIESSVCEGYAYTIVWDKSCLTAIIRIRHIKPCINIVGFPSEVHLHIKHHITWHKTMHWQRLFAFF